jgi:guanylate kinase
MATAGGLAPFMILDSMSDSHSPAPEQPNEPVSSTRRIIVLSAPSGAGKTTIAHRLLERNPGWRFSVSATTRGRRPNEIDGKDYYFLTVEEFRRRIAEGDLVEWEEIYGNLYGTLKSEIASQLDAEGKSRVIFDVDVKGAHAIQHAFPRDAFLIFVAPPSFEELKRRLMSRQTESPESIQARIDRAAMELEMRSDFDVIVVNDDVDRAVGEIEDLLRQ